MASCSQVPFSKVTRQTTEFFKTKKGGKGLKNLFEVRNLIDTGKYRKNARRSTLTFFSFFFTIFFGRFTQHNDYPNNNNRFRSRWERRLNPHYYLSCSVILLSFSFLLNRPPILAPPGLWNTAALYTNTGWDTVIDWDSYTMGSRTLQQIDSWKQAWKSCTLFHILIAKT